MLQTSSRMMTNSVNKPDLDHFLLSCYTMYGHDDPGISRVTRESQDTLIGSYMGMCGGSGMVMISN